ncbi:hypothetical protein [Streptomyces sp. NBC_00414]|uniref:hypothetical protein n=1 Tax=Streptomyces sp. NBC_00414 TaxID=2975739 RepID=UPI002E1CF05A
MQDDRVVAYAQRAELLRMALERSAKIAIAKYAWSGRERSLYGFTATEPSAWR